MREIKFRGKRIDNGEWIYGNLVKMHGNNTEWTTGIQVRFYGAIKYGSVEVNPKTVGQFTGFKGKNGKEIYEGDILRIFEYYCEEEPELNEWKDKVVEWNECGGCLSIEWDYGDYDITSIGWAFEHFDNSGNEVEVIGNVHENPELLVK